MEEKMKEKLKLLTAQIWIVVPLLLVSAYSSSTSALAPILRNIQVAFPEASLTLVQQVLTLPSAVSIPVQLSTVLFAQYLTKKKMMLIAMGFICLGGLLPLVFHTSIYILIVSSVLIGIGQGFFMPTSNAIIGELFDGNTRGAFMGVKNGVSAFLRSGLTLLAGFLGVAYWYKAYYIFVIMIPLIALFMWKTPSGEVGEKVVGKGAGLKGLKGIFTPNFIVITLLAYCATTCEMGYSTNIAGYIADKGLGDASVAGLATAFNTLSRFFVGILLGFILSVFKRFTLPVGYALNAAGFFTILCAQNVAAIQIGGIVFGIGQGIQMAAGMYYMTEAVDKKLLSQAFGLYMPCISMAVSTSPFIINGLSKLLLGEVSSVNNFRIAFYGYVFTAAAMALYQLFFCKNSMIGKLSGLEGQSK